MNKTDLGYTKELADYLRNTYPTFDERASVILSYLCSVYGVSTTAAKLRELGVGRVPKIFDVPVSHPKAFRGWCDSVILRREGYADKEQHYLKHAFYAPQDYIYSCDENGKAVYVYQSPTVYRDVNTQSNYYLSDWIERGEICPECGVAHIPFHHDELCNNCHAQQQPLPYNTRAEDMLGMEETKEIRYGVELEYEDVSTFDIKPIKHHAIGKRDGSINSGIEIVTKPARLVTHKEELRKFYDNVKVKAHLNTGMHVHVEKCKLSQYQIGMMMEFLNHPDLIPHIEKVAGRQYASNTYCAADHTKKLTWGISYDEGSQKIVRSQTGKYSPLNTSKEHTVEVRIFSSPESHLECSAKLDFVAGLVKYSSPYSVSVKSLRDKFNWDVFMSFMASNRKEFPDFHSYFVKGVR